MIIFVTSVTQPWNTVVDYASRYVMEHAAATGAVFFEQPAHQSVTEALAWTEREILRTHERSHGQGLIVAVTLEEGPILRTLRRIREATDQNLPIVRSNNRRWICADDVQIHCLTKTRRSIIRVDDMGECIDIWPEGFFDWRMSELF